MTVYSSDFLKILAERGFIHQMTDAEGLDKKLKGGKVAAYIGFDCTAPSLHVGSLIQIMVLRWLQQCGHKPVVLLGGGTTKIGDPSGKDEARKVLSDDEINRNLESIKKLLSHFIRFGNGATDAELVNNAEWLERLNYISFLRDVGRHFSVNRMLTQDSVKLRLDREQNLSLLEFNYMVVQAYDFVELSNRYGCSLQIGGSDQWGNIIMGVELKRRMSADKQFKPVSILEGANTTAQVVAVQPMIQSKRDESEYTSAHFAKHLSGSQEKDLFGLTTPLLTTSAGAKMGKTSSGAIWLDKEAFSAYDYWQFWRNTEDADVGRFLRLFTELPIKEIEKLEALKGAEINEAKKVLANEATKLAHGPAAAKAAAETALKTFEQGGAGDDLPTIEVSKADFGKGMPAYEIFRLSGLVDSGGEAKRLIRGGGARINDRKITEEAEIIGTTELVDGALKLAAGKKKFAILKVI